MGYSSHLRGELEFSSPISEELVQQWNEFDTSDFNNLAYGGYFVEMGWVDDGDSGKMYYLEEESRKLVSKLAELGIVATGTIVVEGEENADIWRLVFADGSVKREDAKVTWPDGTRYKQR